MDNFFSEFLRDAGWRPATNGHVWQPRAHFYQPFRYEMDRHGFGGTLIMLVKNRLSVAVIGAGPTGMTAALQLSRGHAAVSVYEAAQQVGGLARSLDLWGQRVDLGPHRFFSVDARVNRLWLDVVGDQYELVDRKTRIYYQDKFFHYPLELGDVIRNLGPFDAAMCVASYLKQRLSSGLIKADKTSFQSWVVHRFGRRLFELFFKSYSEKLWGIPCDQLSADFAAQRIKQLSLPEVLISALSDRRARSHQTLVDCFAYPYGGTGAVYEKMADRLRRQGGKIHLHCPVRRVLHDDFDVKGIELNDGRVEQFDHVVSTMPLPLLVSGLTKVPKQVQAAAGSLQFRHTILVYLHIDSDCLFDDQWLYIHSPGLRMGRVTNFRNWVSQLNGDAETTILAVEFWCDESDPIWTAPDERLIKQAVDELSSTTLVRADTVLDGHVIRLPRCYPIYRLGYREQVKQVADYLRQFRQLTPIGRYGAFKYNNQD
ncbi:MAG: FAD-dependent oxidoreductase, partial [Pirellulales bacterium]|nr:FAD-dependent oxidoreductase [Pirellulales bacterium]